MQYPANVRRANVRVCGLVPCWWGDPTGSARSSEADLTEARHSQVGLSVWSRVGVVVSKLWLAVKESQLGNRALAADSP